MVTLSRWLSTYWMIQMYVSTRIKIELWDHDTEQRVEVFNSFVAGNDEAILQATEDVLTAALAGIHHKEDNK